MKGFLSFSQPDHLAGCGYQQGKKGLRRHAQNLDIYGVKMARLDYRKSRKLRVGEYEEKYDPGTVMQNGRVVSGGRPDSLAARAAAAEKEWLEGRAKARKQRRARRQAAKKKPNRGEEARLRAIKRQLTPPA